MDTLVCDYHRSGLTDAWMERMAIFILQSPEITELSLSWFAQYLDNINARITDEQVRKNIWPPVLIAIDFLNDRCPTLQRAVRVISHQRL